MAGFVGFFLFMSALAVLIAAFPWLIAVFVLIFGWALLTK
jgi:hypothetical protein